MSKKKAPDVDSVKLDVRVYPIREPKRATLAFASVNINDMFAVNGIRIVNDGEKNFVSMPQTKDKDGNYRDICFPVMKGLRQKMSDAILAGYTAELEKAEPSVADKIKDGAKKAQEKPTAKTEKAESKVGKEER